MVNFMGSALHGRCYCLAARGQAAPDDAPGPIIIESFTARHCPCTPRSCAPSRETSGSDRNRTVSIRVSRCAGDSQIRIPEDCNACSARPARSAPPAPERAGRGTAAPPSVRRACARLWADCAGEFVLARPSNENGRFCVRAGLRTSSVFPWPRRMGYVSASSDYLGRAAPGLH